MDLTTILAIASPILPAASTIRIGGFKFSAILHEVKSLGFRMDKLEEKFDERIDKLEERMEKRFEKMEQGFEKPGTRMDTFHLELCKHDIRINSLGQVKP